MEIQEQANFGTRLKLLIPELKPRPNTGKLWQDILFLIVVVMVQVSLIPSLFGSYIKVDFVTPWLAISFVRQKGLQGTLLLVVAALAIETHSSIPSGLYLCVYWIMANIIMQVRPTLSWRHQIPWLVMFAVSAIWVVIFEAFVIAFIRGIAELDLLYWFLQLIRVGLATGFGMLLCREWLEFDAEEPVPQ